MVIPERGLDKLFYVGIVLAAAVAPWEKSGAATYLPIWIDDMPIIIPIADGSGSTSPDSPTSTEDSPSIRSAPPSQEEFWNQFARRHQVTDNVYYCACTNWVGTCTVRFGPIAHPRAAVPETGWQPYYNGGDTVPGYFKTDSFGNVVAVYQTNWYLNTGELDLQSTAWCDGTGQATPVEIPKRIWPGEVRHNEGWGVVPDSPDLLNARWRAIVPAGKTFGQDGVGWGSKPQSIELAALGGDGPPPMVGAPVGNRSTIVENGNGVWTIYITGYLTGGQDLQSSSVDMYHNYQVLNGNVDAIRNNANLSAVVDRMAQILDQYPFAHFNVVGHSMGAAEAVVLYNLYNTEHQRYYVKDGTVTLYAPPIGIAAERMKPFSGSAHLVAYCGGNDDICNNDGSALQTVTEKRQNQGVNIHDIDTGFSVLTAHDRCRYQTAVTGSCGW